MKKVFVLLVMVIVITMSACSYIGEGIQDVLFGGSYDDGYDKGYSKGFRDGYHKGASELRQVSRPRSGAILEGREGDGYEITVKAASSNDCVVTLKDRKKSVIVSFYVRAGEEISVNVPAQLCYVYFASGTDWYGYGKGLMFGYNTHYSMDDELVDFTDSGWIYTLKPVKDGNFSLTPIDMDDFFS